MTEIAQIGMGKETAQMEAVEEVVCKVVNFEAYVMELCIKAARTLVERNMQDLGHTTHGPDSMPGLADSPAIPLMATALYKQVRISMREGPAGEAAPKIKT